ncbi:glycosyltransferase family 4 protein [Rivibacter subsaxonicus]|uniref:Glycosyltransferase involved in cell wall biosynthesis n=1 Tax=Rivibacter subsaxonicus TaxID=457575 RepID=A0A4Q7VGS0_9BURK|nr:glycosyltransferase family 4 protein [Rivibacter subsaxonicus]RZT95241.1 glycosyltransferase involved in cell wall biosynthesis [Rivibacter subsaxonicus]
MRLLIPVASFEVGGGFRVLSELSNHWMRQGHEVSFLVDARSGPPRYPTTASVRRFDPHGAEVPASAPRPAFSASGNTRSVYLGMLRALTRIGADYDIILANHSFTALPVALARAGRARKWYYVQAYEPEYYSFEPGWKGRVLQAMSALSYSLPLTQVANAPIYIGYRSIRARDWIPPGLDPAIFHRRRDQPRRNPDSKVTLGVISRTEETKGTIYVLEAFERLARKDERYHLKVAYNNVPAGWSHPRCEIVVPDGDEGLADYYRSIDAMIAPGTVQLGACHYPVLEAMSCGTPVITTGYLPADERNSWIVPVRDAAAIERAVEDFVSIDEPALHAKLDRAALAIRTFYWDAVSKAFMDLMAEPL